MSIECLLESVLPSNVKAIQTNRLKGISQGPYAGFNLGEHVGDKPEHVANNRQTLLSGMAECQQLHWLDQVHSTTVKRVDSCQAQVIQADASVTSLCGQACVVMTADCLPLLIWAKDGSVVAAAHAGWRGLLDGVIENSVAVMDVPPQNLAVWLGPSIGPTAFEVGEEVRAAFIAKADAAVEAFVPGQQPGKWLANLHLLARQRLADCDVTSIYADNRCTYSDAETFFSYRRDGVTGRMASAIWRI